MDSIRRTIATTGAAAAAAAAASPVLAQGAAPARFYERGAVRIHYEEAGSGFPLLLIPGGGLSGTIANLASAVFNPIEELKGEYRCIMADLRNAPAGQSTGPLEVERPWDSYTDDQLGLMDHLGIDRFMVMGFCIGGPFVWNLLRRAPDRVVAAVLAQPSLYGDARLRAQLSDPGADPAGRYSGASLRGRHGGGDAGAQGGGEHVPVEGAEGAHSAGGAPDSLLPAGALAGLERLFRGGRDGPPCRQAGFLTALDCKPAKPAAQASSIRGNGGRRATALFCAGRAFARRKFTAKV